jgi:hypothetical protein
VVYGVLRYIALGRERRKKERLNTYNALLLKEVERIEDYGVQNRIRKTPQLQES